MKRFKPSRPTKKVQSKPSLKAPLRISIGIHAVKEALNTHPKWVDELWTKEGFGSSPQEKSILDLAQLRKIPIKAVPPKNLDLLGSGHQGVAAAMSSILELNYKDLEKEKSLCVALDQVVDPHNLGAVLRTSWLFGASAIFTTKDRSAPLSPTVSKVAQGGLEHVPIYACTSMEQELKELKSKGFWIYGLSHNSTSTLYNLELPDKLVWVLGAEGSGLRKPIERACDELVSIPQIAPDASFNVSVAAGIALGESVRQRGPFFLSKASI